MVGYGCRFAGRDHRTPYFWSETYIAGNGSVALTHPVQFALFYVRAETEGHLGQDIRGSDDTLPAQTRNYVPKFMAALYEIGYAGAVCIEVEDDTFGKTLEGRKRSLKVAKNVLTPLF